MQAFSLTNKQKMHELKLGNIALGGMFYGIKKQNSMGQAL